MGTTLFWIFFWILIAVLILSGINHERQKTARLFEKITKDFGSEDVIISSSDRFDKKPELLSHLQNRYPDAFVIDDITANDLGLRDVYSRMNKCITPAGEDYLYCSLCMIKSVRSDLLYDLSEIFINDRKTAITLLKCLAKYRYTLDRDGFAIIRSLKDAGEGSAAAELIPIALLVIAVILSVFYPMAGIIAIIVMIIVNIGTYFSGRRKMEENLRGLALSLRLIACSQQLLQLGCAEFEKYRALSGIKRGDFLISYKDQTTSDPLSVIFDYVRMITHIDLIAYRIKISKIRAHSEEVMRLYEDIGKLDAALALASYLIPKGHCRARICDDYKISAKDLYHPLVSGCVTNDIETERGILITGSNASGKSTFLKSVGISTLFAQSLGAAFAGDFETGPFKVYTSMALSDNILKGESYYVVEARSIKRICDAAEEGGILCIIDEVLRGTNTIERIAASSRILGFLCRQSVICFAATHDLELTHLLKDDMELYHFTEEISEDNVVFPYVIKHGVSEKTNAIRLLAMLGFDKDIVSSAGSLVERYKSTGIWGNE